MHLKRYFFILFMAISAMGHAQDIALTPTSEISVLTAGSGSELYSSFGHSAIRVKDPTLGVDAVYNYGTFDFTTPNFYTKFARGKLNYTLARQRFEYFLRSYQQENRWVKEQVLNLSLAERKALFKFLETNYLPENRDYKYDFFYNNCATKIWDVFKEVYGNGLVFDASYVAERYTHRQLIRQNVPINSWSGFGIDLALGSVIDDVATPKEYMFLPEFIMKQFGRAQLGSKPLSSKPEVLFDAKPIDNQTPFFLSPAFWLSVFLVTVLLLTYLDFKYNVRRRWLDFILFFTTGAAGCLILFLWFFTDHTATAGNFNALWAFPPNLIVAFVVFRKRGPNWVAKYVLFLMGLLLITLLLWLLGIQIFSPLLILVWLALATRYFFLFWSYQTPILA
ncbi:MAG TPA: DUF4105 domain-containing protein [Pricia sp.]|nr:DUF4105 domain-containing protein [Pricia sp.]